MTPIRGLMEIALITTFISIIFIFMLDIFGLYALVWDMAVTFLSGLSGIYIYFRLRRSIELTISTRESIVLIVLLVVMYIITIPILSLIRYPQYIRYFLSTYGEWVGEAVTWIGMGYLCGVSTGRFLVLAS